MRRILVALVPLVVLGVVVGLWLFEPWRLFTSSEVHEAAPTAAVTGTPTVGSSPTAPATGTVLAEGRFVDAEHGTSGTARILRLADGRRFLRVEDLAGSDGPDLHMWLSDAPSGGDWGSYDDGAHVRLGDLKATHGDQNYPIPADADLSTMRSVVIWCDRFNVAFGTAPIRVR